MPARVGGFRESWHDALVPKHLVRDYGSMSVEELRETARMARRQEQTAPYAKGRRSWKAVWQAAEAELARRGADA